MFQSAAAEAGNLADIACSGIVDIAHNLGAEVMAEWIETDAHAAYAREIGCQYLQGRLFAGLLTG